MVFKGHDKSWCLADGGARLKNTHKKCVAVTQDSFMLEESLDHKEDF